MSSKEIGAGSNPLGELGSDPKEKEGKEKENGKEKERKTKEKEKVKHTRQKAVNHSHPPTQGKNKKPRKVNNNISIMIKIGLKTGGGQKDMPPQINHNGAKTVAGRIIIMIGLPSHTQNVFYPGWNPGTPLTFAKILCM